MSTKLAFTNPVLLIGPINAGKYSIRSVLCPNLYGKDRLSTEYMKIVEYENFNTRWKDLNDPNAIKIYVLDAQKDIQENLAAFDAFLKKTEKCNFNKIWVFLNKFDLIESQMKASTLEKMSKLVQEASSFRENLNIQIRATSIWDDSLFKVFTEILRSSCHYLETINNTLNVLADEVGFDQLVVFHSQTMTPLYVQNNNSSESAILEGISYIFKTYQASQRMHSGPDIELFTIKDSKGLLSSIRINDDLIAFVVIKDQRVEPFALELTLRCLKSTLLKI